MWNWKHRITRFFSEDSALSFFTPSNRSQSVDPTYQGNSGDISKPKPLSLLNIGATCYLNSAFQGMSACDTFVKDINDLCNQYNKREVEQLYVFKELIAILNGCSKSQMEISRNSIFRKWNKIGQQDSYEVLVYAVNEVYNELRMHNHDKGLIDKSDINKWLEVRLPLRLIFKYEITCDCKLTSYSPIQSDLALHVVIPKEIKKYTLKELIDRYFDKEIIDDYQCDRQNCKAQKAYKIVQLYRPLPRTICIHLQRNFWNGYKMKKINKEVPFDNTIVIKPRYCINRASLERSVKDVDGDKSREQRNSREVTTDASKRDNCNNHRLKADSIEHRSNCIAADKGDNQESKENDNKKVNDGKDEAIAEDEVYNLVSVIVHRVTVFGGHYVCYKKVGDNWFLTDDSSVREVRDVDVFKCQAYILFYELPYDRPNQ